MSSRFAFGFPVYTLYLSIRERYWYAYQDLCFNQLNSTSLTGLKSSIARCAPAVQAACTQQLQQSTSSSGVASGALWASSTNNVKKTHKDFEILIYQNVITKKPSLELKFIYSEKDTNFVKPPLYFGSMQYHSKESWRFCKICGLLRIYELCYHNSYLQQLHRV